MLHVAGGIILAVIILAFFPAIIALAGWLMAAALTVAIVAALAYFIFGTEAGNELALWLIALAAIWFILLLILRVSRSIKTKSKQAGGLHYWVADFFFNLRPAITERQKIQKLAQKKIRAEKASQRLEQKEQIARKNFEEHQRREQANRERALDRRFTKANDRLHKKMRGLEKRFSGANMRFHYAEDRVTIYIFDTAADAWVQVASINCNRSATLDSAVTYQLQAPRKLLPNGRECFTFLAEATHSVRLLLRQAAAQNMVAGR